MMDSLVPPAPAGLCFDYTPARKRQYRRFPYGVGRRFRRQGYLSAATEWGIAPALRGPPAGAGTA